MMKLIVMASIAGCASLVSGQHSTPSSSAVPSLAETGAAPTVSTHVVTVGKNPNQFMPDSLTANKGDIIQFQFFPSNHSVGRAEYQQPCIPYEDTGMNKVGFWSGFFPLSAVANIPPTWNLTINDTEPVFFYCAAPGSCINNLMVGVINPNSSTSLDTQKQGASQSRFMLAPGQPFPSEADIPSGDLNPTAKPKSSSGSLSKGGIAGIVIAGVVVALLAAAVFFLLGRHKTMLKLMRGNQHQAPGPQNPPENQYYKSPNADMSTFPCSSSTIPYSGTPNHQYGNFASPPYTKHANHDPRAPFSTAIAELATPMDKQSPEYLEIDEGPSQRPYHDTLDASPISPQQQPKPLFWGRSKSTRKQTSELPAG